MTILHTARLRLEPFTDSHLDGLNAMNSDPEVMRYLSGKPETREETQAVIERVKARWAELGYSWWSFFELASGELIGAGCVQHLGRDQANPLELGWRLRRDKWHQGFALEAAEAMATFAFNTLQAPRVQAVCKPDNAASAKVMTRLGMHYIGRQTWYDSEVAVYEIARGDWQVHSESQGAT
ncbi:GNAT family N-acetyltransferase [Paucibacter sp. APW11]|uniref:GNAT family N-acetyltransferase n=1 Tax=Roseateles aquae TaxID=3077235 RepID=A0ABU3PDG3_9BURK|nr:GNAT family N-acetyltransferase [Paucibacter sp. APW11]MDT9000639.1 GNAT family N-acetyltransferase [Paucibacter sp. APW11]